MIRPLKNQVLIEEIPVYKTPEGFWLAHQQVAAEHRVVAVGPKADSTIVPGTRVLIDKFRCMAKTQVGERAFLIADSSLALVIP